MNPIYLNMSCDQLRALCVRVDSDDTDVIDVTPLNITLFGPKESQYSPQHYSPYSSISSGHYSPIMASRSPTTTLSMANNSMTERVVPMDLFNNPMFDPIRYKTELCKNFQELGNCKFGTKCYYAHYNHELKPALHKPKNYRTVLCKSYHLEGLCDFGSRCAFIHTKPDVDQILEQFQAFINCMRPIPGMRPIPWMRPIPYVTDFWNQSLEVKQKNGKRLKVFENISRI